MHKGDTFMMLREDLDMIYQEDLLMMHNDYPVMMHSYSDYLGMTSREDLIMMHPGVLAMMQLQEQQLDRMDKWHPQTICTTGLQHHQLMLEVNMRHQLEAETTPLGDEDLDNAVKIKCEI